MIEEYFRQRAILTRFKEWPLISSSGSTSGACAGI